MLGVDENDFYEVIFSKKEKLFKGHYENCSFVSCNFHNQDLSNSKFTACVFEECNLSTANLKNTALKTVVFKKCKLLGLNFSDCNPFLLSIGFESCVLDLSSFYKLRLKATVFESCKLQEVDFGEADLASATFDAFDLARAICKNTVLEKADFRTAYNFSIDPEINRIKKAKFSMIGLMGLLDKYGIEVNG